MPRVLRYVLRLECRDMRGDIECLDIENFATGLSNKTRTKTGNMRGKRTYQDLLEMAKFTSLLFR